MTVVFDRIKQIAKSKNMSIASVSDEAGLATGSVYRWKTVQPKTSTLQSVADVLGVTVDYLLGNTDYPFPVQDETQKLEVEHQQDVLTDFADNIISSYDDFDNAIDPISNKINEMVKDGFLSRNAAFQALGVWLVENLGIEDATVQFFSDVVVTNVSELPPYVKNLFPADLFSYNDPYVVVPDDVTDEFKLSPNRLINENETAFYAENLYPSAVAAYSARAEELGIDQEPLSDALANLAGALYSTSHLLEPLTESERKELAKILNRAADQVNAISTRRSH